MKALVKKSVISSFFGQYGLRDHIEELGEKGLPLSEQVELAHEVCVTLKKYHAPRKLQSWAQETAANLEDDLEWLDYITALETINLEEMASEDCMILLTAPR